MAPQRRKRVGHFENTSRFPPIRWRNEWQENEYIVSRNAFAVRTMVPTPMPNPSWKKKASYESIHRNSKMTIEA